jgi:hypothetical protein
MSDTSEYNVHSSHSQIGHGRFKGWHDKWASVCQYFCPYSSGDYKQSLYSMNAVKIVEEERT